MSADAAFQRLRELGLEPVLQAAWEKVRQEGAVKGTAKVALTRRQREELAGLIRLPRSTSPLVPIDLVKLDEALSESILKTGLVAVLEAGYGPLITRRQERENEAARWNRWLADLSRTMPEGATSWMEGIASGVTPSARWVRRAYLDEPAQAAEVVQAVGRALAQLPSDSESHALLAVFAANMTGDPHFFDANRPGGRLLLHALSERFAPPLELDEREVRAFLFDMASLGTDQVSSTVLVAHLACAVVGGGPHPVVAAMGAYGGGWRVTLGEVRRWSQAAGRSGIAFVVENPPVFEYLERRLETMPAEERPTLICTEGFLSAAAVRLLDLLVAGGTQIRYSGDFDPNGLAIANWVLARYAGACRPWRMNTVAYHAARTGDGQLGPPETETTGGLAETIDAVAKHGAAYQERLVEWLLQDCLHRSD